MPLPTLLSVPTSLEVTVCTAGKDAIVHSLLLFADHFVCVCQSTPCRWCPS